MFQFKEQTAGLNEHSSKRSRKVFPAKFRSNRSAILCNCRAVRSPATECWFEFHEWRNFSYFPGECNKWRCAGLLSPLLHRPVAQFPSPSINLRGLASAGSSRRQTVMNFFLFRVALFPGFPRLHGWRTLLTIWFYRRVSFHSSRGTSSHC